jgi:Mn-containing catalase
VFHHVKELQFNARVTKADPRFAALLLEQFGGGNGELKAAMQYFVQSFSVRQPQPHLYDMLMDIATEELSHLEIVGATITMLLDGINGELKNAAEQNEVVQLAGNGAGKDSLIHQALLQPEFLTLTGGGAQLTNATGVPWTAAYVNANGDPTVDLRSNIAAESRAKIVYEYLVQLTDDPLVQESLRFLMTREITHFQMFSAALDSIQPNFPPGILQGAPAFSHTVYNMSNGASARGPWNEGQGPWPKGEQWEYIEDPATQVVETDGQLKKAVPDGAGMTPAEATAKERELSKVRSEQIKAAVPTGPNQWSAYPQADLASPAKVKK